MLVYRMILECLSPLHCGVGSVDAFLDQPVARDAFGLWRIPGSSLAGALRALGERVDPEMTVRMFGRQLAERSSASLVWCSDGLLLDFDGVAAANKKLAGKKIAIPQGPFVRDHVKLDLDKDSAVNGGKFDEEIVPAGTRFFVEFRCDGWNRTLAAAEKEYFDCLCALVAAGELDLGGKTSNGCGLYSAAKKQYREIDLNSEAGLEAWLNLPYGQMLDREGVERPLPEAPKQAAGKGLNGVMRIPLSFTGPILIAGGSPNLPDGKISEADMIFALSPFLNYKTGRLEWRWTIPGSSLKGVLRHAVYRILKDIDHADVEDKLKNLFGFVGDSGKGQCGKIQVADCQLSAEDKTGLVQHVKVDRFTGGASDGALFSEEPLWAQISGAEARIRLAGIGGGEAAPVFHALLDLAEGSLAVGSGCNRGNGRLVVPGGFNGIRGDLAWNGAAILAEDAGPDAKLLRKLAAEWDAAMLAGESK